MRHYFVGHVDQSISTKGQCQNKEYHLERLSTDLIPKLRKRVSSKSVCNRINSEKKSSQVITLRCGSAWATFKNRGIVETIGITIDTTDEGQGRHLPEDPESGPRYRLSLIWSVTAGMRLSLCRPC